MALNIASILLSSSSDRERTPPPPRSRPSHQTAHTEDHYSWQGPSVAHPPCGNDHGLRPCVRNSHGNNICDVCEKTIQAADQMFRCHSCDYDMCPACYNNRSTVIDLTSSAADDVELAAGQLSRQGSDVSLHTLLQIEAIEAMEVDDDEAELQEALEQIRIAEEAEVEEAKRAEQAALAAEREQEEADCLRQVEEFQREERRKLAAAVEPVMRSLFADPDTIFNPEAPMSARSANAAAHSARDVSARRASLLSTADSPLVLVVRLLQDKLAGPRGVESLKAAFPQDHLNEDGSSPELSDTDKVLLEEQLKDWQSNFAAVAERMPTDMSDVEAMQTLKMVFRGVLNLVSMWTPGSCSIPVMRNAVRWVLNVLVHVSQDPAAASGVDVNRLRMLMSIAHAPDDAVIEEDIPTKLLDFGCKPEAVEGLSDDVARALLQQLRHWDAHPEEEETFTCTKLVEDGKIQAGLGLVVRGGGENGSRVHFFPYNYEQIQVWIGMGNQDPVTRSVLRVEDVIQIS